MDTNLDNIKRLFESLKGINFFSRLFNWAKVKNQLVDASADLQKMISKVAESAQLTNALSIERAASKNLTESVARLNTEVQVLKESNKLIESLQRELTTALEQNKIFLKRGTELSNELSVLRERLEATERELQRNVQQNTQLIKDEEFRKQDHSKAIASLENIQARIQNDRNRELQERKDAEINKLHKLRETWSAHQENVQNTIKTICSKHTIEYVEKVPFKGEPDNTLKISNEFVVFDAKSPAGEDLSNFKNYLKNQAESAKKYVKEQDVKKDIFLVVPTNTLEILDQYVFRLADYNVFVISIDSLEPVILSLLKIEDYEFAEQLSPEERENICRVLGKFVHLSKRRIQIDGFFTRQFFELVYRSEADLPKDILEKVSEFEKAEKINPPIERRAKQISAKELEHETSTLKSEANSKGIITEDSMLSNRLNKLPLYSSESYPEKKDEQGGLF
jgi:myosin heavy subunit